MKQTVLDDAYRFLLYFEEKWGVEKRVPGRFRSSPGPPCGTGRH